MRNEVGQTNETFIIINWRGLKRMTTKLKKRSQGYSTLLKKYTAYKKDVVKFVEDCVCVYQPCEEEVKKIKLDYIQKKILRSFMKDHNLYLLTSRQVGTSTTLKALITHMLVFQESCSIGVISRDNNFVLDIQKMLDNLSLPLTPKYIIKQRDRIILENGCDVMLTTNPNPHTTFLGNSLNVLIIDDAAYIKNLHEVLVRLYPMLATVQRISKERKKLFGVIISSTPNRYDEKNYFQQLWNSSEELGSTFTPIEVYWKRIARFREDPDWYTNMCRNLCNDKTDIDRELNLKFV